MSTIRSVIRKEIRRGTVSGFNLLDIDIPSDNVIFSHNSRGLEPDGDYCSINMISNRRMGHAEESTRTKQGATYEAQSLANTAHFIGTVQFSFFGDNAADNAMEFHNGIIGNRQVIEGYQRLSIVPVTTTDLKILPKFRETDWVESAVFDVNFGYSVQRYQDILWVEYIVINGNTYKITGDD